MAEKINQYEARQWEKDEVLSGCVNSLLSLTEWGKEEKTTHPEQHREMEKRLQEQQETVQAQMEEPEREHDKQYTEMEKKLEKRSEGAGNQS